MAAPSGRDRRELLRRTFEYGTGRMIALTRAVIAVVFFLSLWLDPQQPVRATVFGYSLLAGYLLLAVALLALAWRSWWWDHRLASPVMLVDAFAFLSAVFFTEGAGSDFTSPFLAFFVFLMLSATLRWDWRMTLAIGLAVTGLYLLVGLYIASIDADFDIYRFGRRTVYMLVMALVLAWFGLQRRVRAVERFIEQPGVPGGDQQGLLEQALGYALAHSHAARGAIAWGDHEEPDLRLGSVGIELPQHRLGPEQFDAESGLGRDVRLFDRRRGRSLVARRDRQPLAVAGPVDDRLSEYCGIEEGVALPLIGLTGRGELLLCDIGGLSADHVTLGTLLAREITAAFDRQATLALASETALARLRETLARDVHDTVAQSLSGASLRLEGLRAWIRNGGDAEPEIEAIKQSLRDEQRHVRTLIARLRSGATADEKVDPAATVRPLLSSLSVQWGVAARLLPTEAIRPIPVWLAHEIGQVLREAVANAVRHGRAERIDVTMADGNGELRMTIEDNGGGFGEGDPLVRPSSISERLDKLGGRLEVATGPDGTRLDIALPAGGEA